MDYILFDDIATELPLVAPEHFRQYTDYNYDPATGTQTTEPVTEYWVSFLVQDVDTFIEVKSKLINQLAEYRSGNIVRLGLTVSSQQSLGDDDGSYSIFWVLEDWYSRLGSSEFLVTLHGYGEPTQTQLAIVEGQSFSVSEDANTGTVVGTILGFSESALLTGRPDLPFSYDATSGTLSVSGSLNYEETDEYTLTIGNTPVTVYVLDIAEAPLADRPDYDFYVKTDGFSSGSSLGKIEVTVQGDTGIKPVFSIVSGNTGNNFAIDPYTGELIMLSLGGLSDGHIVTVSYGTGLTVSCVIHLLTADNQLQLPTQRFNLNPLPATNQVVGTYPTGLSYSLASPNFSFDINSSNQLVVVDGTQINEQLLELSVIGTDANGNTGEFTTFVNVYDPTKLTQTQEFWIAVDSSNGSSVGQVSIDAAESLALSYTLTPSTVFSIVSDTGDIIITAASILAVGTYLLTVTATPALPNTPITKTVRVIVYDVATESDLALVVADTATIGVVVGTLGTLQYPVTLSNGNLASYGLDVNTGQITVTAVPVVSTSFTVVDSSGDSLAVNIQLESEQTDTTDTSDTYLGDVFAGQSGQAIATLSNIRYSVGSVGFGQGSLQVVPDNTDTGYNRNLGGGVVLNKPASISYKLSISTEVTPAMLNLLTQYWDSPPTETYLVSVDGTDWDCYLVSYQASYADTRSVQLTLVSVLE